MQNKYFLTNILFFITLESFYFYSISIAPFPIVSFFIIIFYNIFARNFIFSKNVLYYFIFLITFFIISTLIGFFNNPNGIRISSIIAVFLGSLFYLIFYYNYYKKINELIYSLERVILIHTFFWLIQVLSFYFFSYKLDFLILLTGEESRITGSGPLTGMIRASGLFNEPGSYSLVISIITFILIIAKKKISYIEIAGILSCFFSFSVSGMLFSLFLFFLYFKVSNNRYNYLVLPIIFIFLFHIILFFYLSEFPLKIYIEGRFFSGNDDGSLSTRFIDPISYFKTLDINKKIFGIGLGNYSNEISSVASGIFAYLIHFGFFFTLIFFLFTRYFLVLLKVNINYFLLSLVFLFGPITFYRPSFWLFFTCLMILGSNINSKSKLG